MTSKIEKVSMTQVILLLILFRLLTSFAYLPTVNTPPANQDVWIAELISLFYSFILALPLLFLFHKFKELTIIQCSEKIMGKYIGRLIGLLFIGFMLFQCLVTLNSATVFLRTAIFPETPEYATAAMIVCTSIYVVFKGIETIARGAEIFVPIILVIIIVFALLGINNMDFSVFLPVLSDSNVKDLNIGALFSASQSTEIILFAMFIPYINDKSRLTKSLSMILTVSVIFLLIITVSTQATLGDKAAIQANYPFFTYTRLIDVFDFIQRIESINVIAWVIASIGKFSIYLYFATIGIKQVFGTKSNKGLIMPLAVVLYILSLTLSIRKSVILNLLMSYKVFPFIVMPFILVIPVIMIIVYYFRRKSITV